MSRGPATPPQKPDGDAGRQQALDHFKKVFRPTFHISLKANDKNGVTHLKVVWWGGVTH
jgi:hypothetical protein